LIGKVRVRVRVGVRVRVRVRVSVRVRVRLTCAWSFCAFFNLLLCKVALAFSITLQRQDKSQAKTLEKQ
jgi:hypothetical protein